MWCAGPTFRLRDRIRELLREVFRQLGDIALQSNAQPAQYGERHISFTSLYRTEIRSIYFGSQGKPLLRKANALALQPDPAP